MICSSNLLFAHGFESGRRTMAYALTPEETSAPTLKGVQAYAGQNSHRARAVSKNLIFIQGNF